MNEAEVSEWVAHEGHDDVSVEDVVAEVERVNLEGGVGAEGGVQLLRCRARGQVDRRRLGRGPGQVGRHVQLLDLHADGSGD